MTIIFNKFMWALKPSSRILDRKMKQQAHQRHMKNLRGVRSTLNNSTPKYYSFLYSRPKAKLTQLQRQKRIQTNNTILVEKMVSTTSHLISKNPVVFKNSMHVGYNKRKERQISLDNEILVRRLQNTTSHYDRQDIFRAARKYDKWRTNLINSKVDQQFDLGNSKRLSNSRDRPDSAKLDRL